MILLALALAAPATSPPPPVEATIDQLRARPSAYAGKRVRVAGQMDMCWNMGCSLCPLEATPAVPQWQRCVGVSFDRFRAIPASHGADMDGAFRYADLVLVARFDPACFDLCLDKASVLFDARVEKVTRRRHSRDGLIWRPDVLRDAAAAEADAVVALVRDTDKQDEGLEFRAFLTDDPEADSGVVCRKAERGGGPWPTSWEGAIVAKSTEDTYRCWRARKVNGAWRISF